MAHSDQISDEFAAAQAEREARRHGPELSSRDMSELVGLP
ncbi:MAG: hypothetical protein K0R68_861 [Mycobacterium sp.]|nr:hypothetical protein [Mycobacterium sp.]